MMRPVVRKSRTTRNGAPRAGWGTSRRLSLVLGPGQAVRGFGTINNTLRDELMTEELLHNLIDPDTPKEEEEEFNSLREVFH